MKKSIQASKTWVASLDRKTVLYGALSVTVCMSALMMSFIGSLGAATPHEDPNTQQVLSRLNGLQTQLASLQDIAQKPLPDVDFSVISQQITEVSERLEALRATHSDEVRQTLNHTETALSSKLDSITDVVSHIDPHPSSVKFLALDALPFKVVSIDSIQQIPVASIAYDFKTVPLEQGDALAGWRVVSLDYTAQRIELVNQQKEHVLVTHAHMG